MVKLYDDLVKLHEETAYRCTLSGKIAWVDAAALTGRVSLVELIHSRYEYQAISHLFHTCLIYLEFAPGCA